MRAAPDPWSAPDERAPATVLTSRRALTLHTRAFVRAQLAGRRWQRPARGVLITHNGPMTDEETLWVALLGAPTGSALGGLTAANLDGLAGFEPDSIDVLIPDGARRPDQVDGVTIRRSSFLTGDDIHPIRSPRRTRLPRSVIDSASWSNSAPFARVLVLASVQQGLARPLDFDRLLERRQRFRHRSLIAETIGDAAGGIQSLPELGFARLIRRCGLPEPSRQRVLRRRDGRFYLDAAWDRYDAACEIQGIPHMRVGRWEADMSRSNEIMIAGPRLLSFSSYAVRHEQHRVADQLARLLRRGGWG